MKASELKKGLKVITVGARPITGYIVKTSCLGGKSPNNPANIFVKIRKLDGVITYSPGHLLKRFSEGTE